MSDALEQFARRCEADPTFLGAALARYARAEKLDHAALAEMLGCPPEALTQMKICRAPRPDPAGLRDDLTQVAERFGVPFFTLVRVVKAGQGHLAADSAAPAGARLLAARRADEEAD